MNVSDQGDLVDRIYEAAFVPELWPNVLGGLADATGSAASAVLVFYSPDRPPLYHATEITASALEQFTTGDEWRQNRRVEAISANHLVDVFSGFTHADALPADRLADDSVGQALKALGLGAQITTAIPMLTGELVLFTFERWASDGHYIPAQIGHLNDHRPHLARAGLVSARLRLERARATVSVLDTLDVPAAVVQKSGRVLAVNNLLESLASLFRPAAFGHLALADPGIDRLLKLAISDAGNTSMPVRSIPLAATEDRPGAVIHVLPLVRSAHDIFSSGDMLVVANLVGTGQKRVPAAMLTALFDLSPSEAKLAAGLAMGNSVTETAAELGVTVKTARTYLERVFAKTGTHRQSDLVGLLRSTFPSRS